ncbi:MAG: recombination mediator RecR [Pirellulales bacterium]|jgi:recombination protein RecR|nr:recombination mediator RecR [Pirellulales bacterium]
MDQLSQSVSQLVDYFERFPGIGNKSAQRLAYYILRIPEAEATALADAILQVKKNVHYCSVCFNLTEEKLCSVCSDNRRDRTRVLVVEQPRDLMALEATANYRGLYHVLLGRIAPLEGIGPEQLTIEALTARIKEGTIEEIIMGTNPTLEGDGTALYISNVVGNLPIKITRLARGITSGSVLEHANREMLSDAIDGRQPF